MYHSLMETLQGKVRLLAYHGYARKRRSRKSKNFGETATNRQLEPARLRRYRRFRALHAFALLKAGYQALFGEGSPSLRGRTRFRLQQVSSSSCWPSLLSGGMLSACDILQSLALARGGKNSGPIFLLCRKIKGRR